MMTTLSSLAATSGATIQDKVGIMTTRGFLWYTKHTGILATIGLILCCLLFPESLPCFKDLLIPIDVY